MPFNVRFSVFFRLADELIEKSHNLLWAIASMSELAARAGSLAYVKGVPHDYHGIRAKEREKQKAERKRASTTTSE